MMQSRKNPRLLSVILPCYNEEAVIALTHQRVIDVLGTGHPFDLEVVYVNDGSRDSTGMILHGLATADPRVKVISFSRNFGHQAAVSAGLDHAAGDIVAVIDADLQDPPEVIVEMIEKWRAGFDAVYGVRRKRKESLFKRTGYSLFYKIFRALADVEMPLDSGDFSLMDRKVVDALKQLPEKERFIRGLRAWVGFHQTEHVYERHHRAAGETKYPLYKLIKLAMDGIFNFSTVPLSVVFAIGIAISLLSFFIEVGLLLFRFSDVSIFGHTAHDVPGYTSFVFSILFFGGIQLVSVGVLGEYIGRIYYEVKRRPTYMVQSVIGGRTPAEPLAKHEDPHP